HLDGRSPLHRRNDLRPHLPDHPSADRRLPLVSYSHLDPTDRAEIYRSLFRARIPQSRRDHRPQGGTRMTGAEKVTEAKHNPVVLARNVRKSFGANEVLKGVNLSVMRSQVVVILGSSGSGKSTFLRCLNQLEDIDGGWIEIDGEPIGYTYS